MTFRPTLWLTLWLTLLLTHLRLALLAAERRRDERGDVPGWVLITVMTAGLVGALWKFAGPRLETMLSQALSTVS